MSKNQKWNSLGDFLAAKDAKNAEETGPVRAANPAIQQTPPPPEPVSVLNPTTSPQQTRSSAEPIRITNGYTRIINHLLDDVLPSLEPAEQVILLRLYRLSHGHNNACCKVSRQTLVNKTGVKRTRLLQALAKLQERGYIKRLADDIGNSDIYNRGMSFEMLLEAAESVHRTNPSIVRTGSYDGPIKENTLKETTQTQKLSPTGVHVGSKFTLEECRRYAKHLQASGQGINNPGGYATTIHRTGEADLLIAAFLNPEEAKSSSPLDASQCTDCNGTGFYYPQGIDGGVAKCKHASLPKENNLP